MDMIEIFGEPISIYTRDQALTDGVLYDLTEWANERGFCVPVAVTASVMADLSDQPEDGCHSIRGRADDLLWMAYLAAKRQPKARESSFSVILENRAGEEIHHIYRLSGGPGDSGEMVITILKEGDD